MKMPNQMRVLESLCGNQPHKKPAIYMTMLVIMKWRIVWRRRLQLSISKITVVAAKVVPINPVKKYWMMTAAIFVPARSNSYFETL